MPAVAVSSLITRARGAADMQDDFVDTALWLAWANLERVMLENVIARSGYILKEERTDITATGASEYNVADPVAIIAVYEFANGRYRRLRPSDIMDGAGRLTTTAVGPASTYRVYQNTNGNVSIEFFPNPASGTYKVYAIGQPALFTLTTDTCNYPMGWEDYIVYGMAQRALAKEETVNPALERKRQEIEAHIGQTAWHRQFAAHQQVRNVDKVERGWLMYPIMPSAESWYFV